MTTAIVRWSINHRGFMLSAWIVIFVVGSWISTSLKLDAMPDLTNNQVQILTRAPGLMPEEVERRVTRPLELGLGGLPGLVTHRSSSRYGLSAITAVFADDIDPYRVRQMVQERLARVALPVGVPPAELGPLSGGLGEIFQFTLSSENRTPTELLELVELRLGPELRRIPGIVEVNTWGGAKRTFEVVVDPVRLEQRGQTLEQVVDLLGRNVTSVAGASLETRDSQTLLRGAFLPRDPNALSSLMLDPNVRLGDVASLNEGILPRLGAATRNGQGETVYVMLQMLRGANAREVMERVHAAMPAAKKLLPTDIRLDVVYDRSVLVGLTLRTMAKNLFEGGALVVLVLFLLLGSLRAGVIVAAVIPLAMVGATTLMTLVGLPGNLMSLGAVDFGLIVDGAVVMVEGIFHATAHANRAVPFRQRAAEAAEHVAAPVLFAVLVIMIVYVPILTLSGVDGQMFRPMALTVVCALAVSLLAALTFVPAAAASLLDYEHIPSREPLLVRGLRRIYPPLLEKAEIRPALVLATFVAMLALGSVLFARAGSELAPQLDEGDLVVQTTRSADVSLAGSVDRGLALERAVLAAIPEATSVASRVGSPAVSTDMMGLEQADVFISLRPKSEWKVGRTTANVIDAAAQAIEREVPGSAPSFTQPIQMRFNELLGGAPMDVVVSVFGEDLSEIRELADHVQHSLLGVSGVTDSKVLSPPDVPLLDVEPNPLALAQYGLRPSAALQTVEALRSGIRAATTYLGPVEVPIVVRLNTPLEPSQLRSALVATAHGAVPLERIARINSVNTTSLVQHDDGKRRVVIGFNVRGGDLQTVVENAQAAVERDVKVPVGISLHWGGQHEVLREAQARMKIVVPLALVAIFALLLIAFRSVRPVLVIATQVPFASVGGIIALTWRDMPLSIAAIVGFVALSGVAVMNGVVLLNETLMNQRSGASPRQAVHDAAISRARPVIMTALVAMLGFVPMMLSHGVGAEVQRPLATVVVAGLITSTLLTLLVLPVLYPLTYGRRS